MIKEVLKKTDVLVGYRVWESLAALNINGMKRLPEGLHVVELGEPTKVDRSCYYYQGLNGCEEGTLDRMVSYHLLLKYSLQVIECQEQMERYLDMVNRDKELEAVDALGGQLEKLSVVGEKTEKVQSVEGTSLGQAESQQAPRAKVEIPFGSKVMSGKEVR